MDTPAAGHLHRTKPAKTAPAPPRRVRVVAKIRSAFAKYRAKSLTATATSSVPWISIDKPQGLESRSVTLTLGGPSASRKESYQLDFCYEQHEGNTLVFEREVRPLIAGVFNGCNATVIASGARASGKSHLIQGNGDELGLATSAVAEMLQMVEGNGNAIEISCFEANADHVYDLLGQSRQEVSIWGDGQGNIKLKGLARVAVTCMSEFQKLFNSEWGKSKPVQKTMMEPSPRSHRGLIVYVLSQDEKLVGKMNFIDLAGYEDQRKRSGDGSGFMENAKINKSIYALHNVMYSLSANEAHVRYRETKLTHMLQDSLGGASKILMVTCLNPSFCEDSSCMVSLASRSCQNTIKGVPSSAKKPSSLARPAVFDSPKSQILRSASTTTRKQIVVQIDSEKKASNVPSALKVRKLFGEAKPSNTEKIFTQASSLDINLTTKCSLKEQGKLPSTTVTDVVTLEENWLPVSLEDANPICIVEACPLTNVKPEEIGTLDKDAFLHAKENSIEDISIKESFLLEEDIEKENKSSLVNEGGSPAVSARLKELSNHLKLLYNSTPSYAGTTPTIETQACMDFVEPRTPDQCTRTHDELDVISDHSPWHLFSACGSRAKNSLVQEYLNFLNTASKEDLKKLKGIGEKRATYIIELRENSPEPFKHLDDLQNIGLSGKQITRMIKKEVGELFN